VASARGAKDSSYAESDEYLGWANARQNRVFHIVKIGADGSLISDTNYSLNEYGLRRGDLSQSDTTIWFFGDSFTFGEGVSDTDTLPNQFSSLSGFRAINLGVSGYGPHQMLRILELDRPTLYDLERPAAVVYTALADHIRRAAGLALWDRHGPLYNAINGDLKLIGPFEPAPSFFENQLLIWSRTYREVYRSIRRTRSQAPTTEDDRERFLAIVERSKKIIAQKYGVKLIVVLWDGLPQGEDAFNSDWIAKHLSEKGIPLFRVSIELPQLRESKYYIPNDGHPNADGYRLVADALVKFLPAYLGRRIEASGTSGSISSQEGHAH
jgi:lysophospholipase L1-like esterase